MELKKRFRLTLADYTAFNFFHLKGRLIAMPLIFIVLMPVAIMFIDLANYGYVDPMILIATLVVAIVLGAVVTLINIVSVRYTPKSSTSRARLCSRKTTSPSISRACAKPGNMAAL